MKKNMVAGIVCILALSQNTVEATVTSFHPIDFFVAPARAVSYRLNELPMETATYTAITGGSYTFYGSYQFLVALECECFGVGTKPFLNVASGNPQIASVEKIERSDLNLGPKIFSFIVTLRTQAVMSGLPKPKTGTAQIYVTGAYQGYEITHILSFTTLPATSTIPAMRPSGPTS